MPARPAVVWRQPKVLAAPGLQPGLPAALSSQCEAFDAGPVTVVPQNFQDDNGVRHAQMLLSTTTAPTLALNILWFCDTDHANCNTGSVAHDFQQLPVTKDTVAEKNFALRCSEQTPWRSYGKETTQTGTLRPEETHSKLNSFDTRGSKAPQWLERILPSTGQKRQWRIHCEDITTARHPATSSIGSVWDRERSEKNTGSHAARLHFSKMNPSHGPEVDMFSINLPRHAHKQSAQPIC